MRMRIMLAKLMTLALVITTAVSVPGLVMGDFITNGQFAYTGPTNETNGNHWARDVNVTGWGHTTASDGRAQYISIYNPSQNWVPWLLYGAGTTVNTNPAGTTYWGSFPVNYTGNIMMLDGDTSFHSNIFQTISGLKVGQSYELSFLYGYGQQAGGSTGNINIHGTVNLGGSTGGGWATGGFSGGTNYSLPSTGTWNPSSQTGGHTFTGWDTYTQTFVANSTSLFLGIGAVGNGQPPVMLVADVQLNSVPEPASISLMVMGMVSGGACYLRRRAAAKAAV